MMIIDFATGLPKWQRDPWAVLPEFGNSMREWFQDATCEGLRARHGPDALLNSPEALAARRSRGRKVNGQIAVLGLRGLVTQRYSWLTAAFGGTSTEEFGAWFDEAIASEDVGAVIFDVDSPGGSVFGVEELAYKIQAAKGKKPIIAVANSMAASAAYWIASAADEVVVMPSGQVGSIGVILIHTDWSKAMEEAGVTETVITAGKHKAEGDPGQPLSDEDRERFQETVDAYYAKFVASVSRGRGATKSTVTKGYGQGRMLLAEEAKAAGMVDRIATLELEAEGLGTKLKPAGRPAYAAARARTEHRRAIGRV